MTEVSSRARTIAERCRQFALPQLEYDERFGESIALIHARALVKLFVDRYSDVISQRSNGLLGLLDRWLWSNSQFETIWDPSFGALQWALESGEPDPVEIATRLALRIGVAGQPGDWTARLERDVSLRWERWILPTGNCLSVMNEGTRVRIDIVGHRGHTESLWFQCEDTRWHTADAEYLLPIDEHGQLYLVPQSAVVDQLAIEDEFHSIVTFPGPTPELAHSYATALELLRRCTPMYFDWVVRVLRGIVPCQCGDSSRTRSSSWLEAPGTVLVSAGPTPVLIAEMLVHEACHQYFYLLRRLGPVNDTSDSTLYYSPAVDRDRPLDRILMAYHAFANVLLFYEAALSSDLKEDLDCVRTVVRLREDVELMEGPLRDNIALTPLGYALVQPLMERLRR